jgi:hypothetical protein
MEKFKNWCKKAWKKFVVFWKEIGNFFTNLLCPILSLIAACAELLQLPTKAIQGIKKAEYWAWNLSGTKDVVDGLVEGIDDIVDKYEEQEQQGE